MRQDMSLSPSTSPKSNTKNEGSSRSSMESVPRDSYYFSGLVGRPSASTISSSIVHPIHRPKLFKGKKSILNKFRSHDTSKQREKPKRAHSADETLRHAEVTEPTESQTEPTRKALVRVFRENGTFGTLACPVDATTTQLIKFASRKFFIQDPERYRLVFQRPESSTFLAPNDRPVAVLHDITFKAGYKHDGHEDLTFLGRFVLKENAREDEQELFLGRPDRLRLADWCDGSFPDFVLENADKIRSLELYRCSVHPIKELAEKAPHVHMCRLRDCVGISQVPMGLENFKMLQTLDLRKNAITRLDFDFSQLPALTALDVSGNCLQELPQSLTKCPLKSLFASTNSIRVFDAFVPTLEEVNLDYNLLKCFGPSLANSTNLRRLNVAYNYFSVLPYQLEFIQTLDYLDFSGNNVCTLSPCRGLSVSTLKLNANTPNQPVTEDISERKTPFVYMPNLTAAYMSQNGFELSKEPHCPVLVTLDISSQLLAQRLIKFPLDSASCLVSLNISNNALGVVPSFVSECKNLKYLNMSNNALSQLPQSIVGLKNLVVLELYANNLKSLPVQFSRLSSLETLNLCSNLFESLSFLDPNEKFDSRRNSAQTWVSGEAELLDDSYAEVLPSLRHLLLADNRLNEEALEILVHAPKITELNISYNDINDLPMGSFSHLTKIQKLYLSGNRLGTLPQEEFERLTDLRELYLNGNRLHTLPAEFAKLEHLEVLDVSDNNLHYNVSNWPFDWNWRWNKELKYLSFSSNRRLEIKQATDRTRSEDLTDFNVLPQLKVLGLVDVTVLHPSVPDQSEDCRIRTYGADLNGFKFGIADLLGQAPLGIQDVVIDHFLGAQENTLIGMFDGQSKVCDHGNRISKLVQETAPGEFKKALASCKGNIEAAMTQTFKTLHADIGNIVVSSSCDNDGSDMPNKANFDEQDKSTGTGGVLCFMEGNTAHIATMGGSQCVVSLPDGNHRLLNEPHTTSNKDELEGVRSTGAVVVDKKIDGITEYTRLIGCYTLGASISRKPSYTNFKFNSSDILIIATAELWKYITFSTAADIVRGEAGNAALAALKLRDLAIAYGCTERLMVMVLEPSDGRDVELSGGRKRRQMLPQDSLLARLGGEVAPPLGDVTLVFTDIRHSTLLWDTMPTVMRNAIKIHNSIMRRTSRLMSGYEVKTEGDAFILAFHTPIEAVLWCLTAQQQLLVADWPPMLLNSAEGQPVHINGALIFQGLRVRMGIHRGRPVCEQDPITGRMDYFGPMVNKAARISGVADGGQITVSQTMLDLLHSSENDSKKMQTLNEIGYVSVEVGELKLKGIETPEHIHILYPKSLACRTEYNWQDATVQQAMIPVRQGGHNNSLGSVWSLGPSMDGSTDSSTLQMYGRNGSRLSTSDGYYIERIINVVQRLENMSSYLKTGHYQASSTPNVTKYMDNDELLESLVSRIEDVTTAMAVNLAAPRVDIIDLIAILKHYNNP